VKFGLLTLDALRADRSGVALIRMTKNCRSQRLHFEFLTIVNSAPAGLTKGDPSD
jgi:hypothetical protein